MCVTSCSYNGSFPENLLSVPPSYCQSFPTYHPAVCSSIIHNISIWKLNVERNLVTPSTFSIDRSEPAACLSARVAQLQILLRVLHYLLGTPLCSPWHVDDVSWIVDHGHVQRAIVIRVLIFNTSNNNIDRDQHFYQKLSCILFRWVLFLQISTHLHHDARNYVMTLQARIAKSQNVIWSTCYKLWDWGVQIQRNPWSPTDPGYVYWIAES